MPTAIDNTNAGADTIKRIVNGHLLIERNGKSYTVTGAELK